MEEELISGCIDNNRKAQFDLYQKYFAFVSGICLRYLHSETLARETVNDIFLKIFTKLELFDAARGSFLGWIKKIAVNTCLDKLKLKTAEMPAHALCEDFPEPVFLPISNLDVKDLLAIMKKLPGRQSVIFNLFVVEGYSHEEIGDLLSITPGNSRWYLNDAKQRLKKLLTITGFLV